MKHSCTSLFRTPSEAHVLTLVLTCCALLSPFSTPADSADPAAVRVGSASVDLVGEDSMVIAGGITAGKAQGQEGRLRCIATVIEKAGTRVAIAACDVLMMTRATLDPVEEEIEKTVGIPRSHILINCTHTHHAPSTLRIHDYGPDATFTAQVQKALVKAVQSAASRLVDCRFFFGLGEEKTVGQNSRVLLDDGQIFWIGPRTNFVRPTGPFDPDLPVLAFKNASDHWTSVLFNHSTHTIGAKTPGKRSASIYGLATQELESELGGVFTFLEGASGSTHNLELTGEECVRRIGQSVKETLSRTKPRAVDRIDALKRPVSYRVRHFDESAEAAAVERYCRKYAPGGAEVITRVFHSMRSELSSQQGESRSTWVQAIRIGDIAIVGVPAEYFTQLGIDIKNRSPFRHTYIAELANDWIGYLPNLEAHKLGGYQVWTGFHSYAEPGTGEKIADVAVDLLQQLAKP